MVNKGFYKHYYLTARLTIHYTLTTLETSVVRYVLPRMLFSVCEQGLHIVDVLYHERIIQGSPFRCQVFDSSKVIVRDLPAVASVGAAVEFDSQCHCLLFVLIK